ncbi:MAG: UDP-N-acetylmuramoyl-L-alanyl-D-glutamate--2,6-diaminopimelate ligase [Microthrixaceae bacterium]
MASGATGPHLESRPAVTLGELGDVVGASVSGSRTVEIVAVTHDSRQVAPGALFCCVVGADHDGHEFARSAVDSGAAALLVQRPLSIAVPQILVADVRSAMGPIAAKVAGDPSRSEVAVVGVTGTNGKTTVVTLIAQILEHLGVRAATIGTLTGARTTPEAPQLQAALRDFADDGVAVVAIEVSSHALAQHRVDGTGFRAAIFTNLGSDHLDFHTSQERYFDAKARLFEPTFTDRGIVNVDDVHGRLLRDVAAIAITSFSLDQVEDLRFTPVGSSFVWRSIAVELPLAGRFNVSNALAAAEAVRALGHREADIAAALAHVVAPPGRFETIAEGQPFHVVVDYAHTPDALENLLGAARELCDPADGAGGRLRVVFGCGGDRDASKRPRMGEVAQRLADSVTVTSDNPRSEDPRAIIDAINAGRRRTDDTIVDRREAIEAVLASAGPGDVVVIAGKGHETTQTIGNAVLPFDDREVARAWLRSRDWGRS